MLKWVYIVLLVLWIVVMWYVVIYAMMRGWGPYIRSKRQKKVRVRAAIRHKPAYHDYDALNNQVQIVQKELIFDCEDGVERTYTVHDDLFDWVEVGDDGDLVFQGDLFVDFEARRPRIDPDKLHGKLTRS